MVAESTDHSLKKLCVERIQEDGAETWKEGQLKETVFFNTSVC